MTNTHQLSASPPACLSPWQDASPLPFVRIFTCGGLRIEVLQHSAMNNEDACYGPPTPASLSVPGALPAQILLKHLVSAPNHLRPADWLGEYWYGHDSRRFLRRVDNNVSLLRNILCPPFVHNGEREGMRRALVQTVAASPGSGISYQLGPFPWLWIDVDALGWQVQQACQNERIGQDALPHWERAYALASVGEYLPEERYSDWAEPTRRIVSGMLRQCVHALTRYYLAHDEQGEAAVEQLLRAYLVRFPTDEDALCALLRLLVRQERVNEASTWFERTSAVLREEGGDVEAHTIMLWQSLSHNT